MSLVSTIAALRTVVDTIDGLRVYADPPDSINEFPSAIVYSNSGDLQWGSAARGRNYHTINVDIFHAGQRLPQAINAAKAWPDLMYTALGTAFDAGTIDIVDTNNQARVSYVMRPLPYNDIIYFGVRFTIRLKEVVLS